jgi:hypothetical protein
MKTLTAEIFAVGKWNGFDITQQMLVDLANNFTRLSEYVDVPLKFGHNDEQPLTDGQPALGWVSKVWVEGEKLFAQFTDIPEIVYNAIEKKQYKNVSIEALFDVEHKGVQYGTVLTAVALLGVDMPAVNTLKDLTTYMTANNLAFTSHATFSKKPFKHSEDHTMGMTAEEQAEFDRLKAENKAKDDLLAKAATESAGFKAKVAEKDAEIDNLKKTEDEAKFTAAKNTVEADLEDLVKENKITPAQRDNLTKDLTAETIGNVEFTIKTLKDNSKVDDKNEQGKHTKTDEDENLSADDQVTAKAHEYAASNKVAFSAAVQHVLKTNPKLAREYADHNDAEG